MREMKDSGVEWIGEIPKDWEIVQVKYLFKIGRGRVIAQTELDDNGIYPVFSSQTKNEGCLGYINTYDFDLSQLTWTTDGANAGTVFLRHGKHNCTNVCGTLQSIKSTLDIRYQKYALEYIAFYHKRADTNGYKIMNNEMASIRTIFPSFEEQGYIANYLDKKCAEIDIAIAKQQKSIEKLNVYKQILTMEIIAKGLNPDVEMKDSGVIWIGEIPSHWHILKLKTHTSMLTPMRDKPQDLGGEIPWIRIEDYIGKYIYESKEGFGVSLETVKEMNLKIYPIGTILCTSSCNLGKCAIVSKELVSNQRFIGIIPDDETLPDYLYYLMLSNTERLNHLSTGTIQANLSRVQFEHLMVQFPPYEEQKEISAFLDKKCNAIDNAVKTKQKIIDRLNSYKRSLIYETVTGKREI